MLITFGVDRISPAYCHQRGGNRLDSCDHLQALTDEPFRFAGEALECIEVTDNTTAPTNTGNDAPHALITDLDTTLDELVMAIEV